MALEPADRENLMKLAVLRLEEIGVQPEARLAEGEPTRVIAAVAKEVGADLVVVGHRSDGLLNRWWSGSRQDYLSDHLDCSVVIARNPMSDADFAAELARIEAG